MKTKLLTLALALCSLSAAAQKQYLIAGSGSQDLAIYEKKSNSIVWNYSLNPGDECNCAIMDGKKIAFSYSKGAKLIDMDGKQIFDYKVQEGEQAQSISKIKGGNYLVAICGSPSRLVELNKKGEVVSQILYNTTIADAHSQFRQVRKSTKGTYLVPIMGGNKIVELDHDGNTIIEIKLDGGPFSVTETKSGSLLTACGHAGAIYKIDYKSGEVSTLISNATLPESAKIEFGAEVVELKNGNTLIANWLGHNGDIKQPMLIEINSAGKVVWQLQPLKEIKLVSTVYPIY